MKIGLDARPVRGAESYAFRLDELLPRYAPEHQYIVDNGATKEVDIYHSFRYSMPHLFTSRRVPKVVTVHNLNFLHYPGLYPLAERIRYSIACRTADRVIAVGESVAEGLAEGMGIGREKIEVVLPLAAAPPAENMDDAKLDIIRAKYNISDNYVICTTAVHPLARYDELFDVVAVGAGPSLVVCGRRTPWSDELLARARERRLARRIEFIYEYDRADLPALLGMSHGFFRLHGDSAGEAVAPLVGAMRAGVPMVLADTPRHREVAGDAAHYVVPGDSAALAAAVGALASDAAFCRELAAKGARRAELYSEAAVARRMAGIYASL